MIGWVKLVLAVMGTFLVVGIGGMFVAGFLGLWGLPVSGFATALAVVLVAYLTAPSNGLTAGAVVLALGAATAWVLLEPSGYPESYPGKAYQPTHVPVIATWLGGIMGLALVFILDRRGPPKPDKKLNPMHG